MKTVKTLLPVAIVALFLSLAFAPAISAEESSQDLTLEIGFKDANGYQFYKKVVVTEEQLSQFNSDFTSWEDKVSAYDVDGEMSIDELIQFESDTVALVEEIRELTKDPETGVYSFPEPLLTDDLISSFINYYLRYDEASSSGVQTAPILYKIRRIFSIGRGRAWLPLNRQGEQFIGMRALPIFIQYTIGYAKSRWVNFIPPAICLEDRLGIFNLITMGFAGLYVNFGERYLDRPAGPVLLIGAHMLIRLGEDIP